MSPDLKSHAASTTTLETAWAVPCASNLRHASGLIEPSYNRSHAFFCLGGSSERGIIGLALVTGAGRNPPQHPRLALRFAKVMPRRLSALLPLLLACTGGLRAATVDFAHDIQPLFAEHCLECHGMDKAKGGLTLTTLKGATKSLKSGKAAVVPGDPAHSSLIERVLTTDLEDRMPPKEKKPLTARQAELLKTWIAEGAKFDLHWAYKPVAHPAPPAVKAASWVRNDIDRFVLAKLEARGFHPSPAADKATLIKRASYDLLGLPPAPEEVDAFTADTSPQAYENLLDRLLASEHYGERWGRHWLDAARYADSDGYEKDNPRRDAWRFRDWVIRAVNSDLPFNEFTIQQLAGDLLPNPSPEQIVATAFHRQTLTNTEGGTDQEQFRVEAVFDRSETTGAVWLGLTVGCARCHSHKYDQISQKEYYQLFAFFNNGDEVTRQVPESPEKWDKYQRDNGADVARLAPLQKALDEARATMVARLPEWEKGVQARLAAARTNKQVQSFKTLPVAKISALSKTVFKAQPDGSWLATGATPKTDTYTLETGPLTRQVTALKLEALTDPSLPKQGPGRMKKGNFVLSEMSLTADGEPVVLHSAKADFEQKKFEAGQVLDGDEQTGWAVAGEAGKPHSITLQLARPLPVGAKVSLKLVQNYAKGPEHVLGRFRLLAASEETEACIAPPDVVKTLNEEPARRNPVVIAPLHAWMEKVDPAVTAAASALMKAKAGLPKPPVMDVRVIARRATTERETKVLRRGNFLDPAEPVVPATLEVLPPLHARTAGAKADRLDLAQWLVSPANPLTPRVTVNQFWGRLFGDGLVRSAGDFGVRGDAPTHPELLDWLATEFMSRGWSRKQMLKLIMMSATYRQASAAGHAPSALQEADPRNELLWRQNRLRVEGEIVRDLYLAASGLLSPKIGGPSVFPPLPPDVAELSYANNFKWSTSAGEDRWRRGMYTFFKRTAPHPDLTTFDCPDANTANIRRTVSNTPLQALTTLNAEAFAEASRGLARRVLTEPLKGDAQRIERCFRLCLGRKPKGEETAALARLLAASREYYQTHSEDAKTMTAVYGVKGVPAVESAAWAATARIVLNLDEVITRD